MQVVTREITPELYEEVKDLRGVSLLQAVEPTLPACLRFGYGVYSAYNPHPEGDKYYIYLYIGETCD